MAQPMVLVDELDVIAQLERWHLPRGVMLDILEQAVGERANVTASDPVSTPGNEMRRWLTRFLRDSLELNSRGWVTCKHNQLEGIRNDSLKLKLVPLNTDAAAGVSSRQPTSVSDKGPRAESVIAANNQRLMEDLFGAPVEPDDPIADYEFLYFCVHASDKSVSAEISRPSGMTAGFVTNFSQRVLLLRPGDMPGLRPAAPVPEEFAEIDKPVITRKA